MRLYELQTNFLEPCARTLTPTLSLRERGQTHHSFKLLTPQNLSTIFLSDPKR